LVVESIHVCHVTTLLHLPLTHTLHLHLIRHGHCWTLHAILALHPLLIATMPPTSPHTWHAHGHTHGGHTNSIRATRHVRYTLHLHVSYILPGYIVEMRERIGVCHVHDTRGSHARPLRRTIARQIARHISMHFGNALHLLTLHTWKDIDLSLLHVLLLLLLHEVSIAKHLT